MNSHQVERYLQRVNQTHTWPFTSSRVALTRWLTLLREQNVVPPPTPRTLLPGEQVANDNDHYLDQQRGLSARTRTTYRPLVFRFLTDKFGDGPIDLRRLCASDLIECVRNYIKGRSRRRAWLMATALRSFLRYARYRGDIVTDLAVHVPAVAGGPATSPPRSLPSGQVEQILEHCPQDTAVGRRDYAILLLLARLGLRASEVIELRLDDLDWDAGNLRIRGKCNRLDQLPLPKDVGTAIAAYLKHDRPRPTKFRHVFLLVNAPLSGFKQSSSVHLIVKQALARAGVDSPRKGAHLFRHSLACEMLRRGRSLGDIGEILRHRNPDTTAIYAKVDFSTLRPLAFPWPGGDL
jgi:site-specific recombinase XerD